MNCSVNGEFDITSHGFVRRFANLVTHFLARATKFQSDH